MAEDSTTVVGAQTGVAEGEGNQQSGSETKGIDGMLPEDLRGNAELADLKIGDLAQGYLDLKANAENTILLPGENATEEEMRSFRDALGIPDRADAYEYEVPDELPEGSWTDDADEAFRSLAMKMNLSKDQARGIVEWYLGTAKAGFDEQIARDARETEARIVAFRTKHGENAPRVEKVAERAAERFFGEDFLKALGPIAKDPMVIEGLYEAGLRLVEDSLVDPVTDIDGAQGEIESDGVLDYPNMPD